MKSIIFKLVPRYISEHIEPIEITNGKYPMAVVHIDHFYTQEENQIYKKLREGKVVEVELVEVQDEVTK